MIHLQRELRDIIDSGLNNSTEDLDFNVALYNANHPQSFARRVESESSYDVQYDPYISVVIEDIQGDYIEVPETTIMNADIVVNFQIPTTKTNIHNVLLQRNTENVYKALDTFRRDYANKPLPVGDSVWQLFDDGEVRFSKGSPQNVTKFALSLSFNDTVEDTIVESIDATDGKFTLVKEGGDVVIYQDGDIFHTFTYETNTYYDIVIEVDDATDDTTITVNGEETNYSSKLNIPEDFTLYSFSGYIEYIGVSKQGDATFDELLIENFLTLEDKSTNSEFTITPDDAYSANEFGKYGVVMLGMSALTPVSNQYQYGSEGLHMQQFQMVFSATYGEDIFPGNVYRYFIDGTEVFPLSMSHTYAPENESDQTIKGKTSKSVTRTNSIGTDIALYHKNDRKLNEILKNYLSPNVEQNRSYEFEVHYPNFKVKYDVIVTQQGSSPVRNTMATLTFRVQEQYSLT